MVCILSNMVYSTPSTYCFSDDSPKINRDGKSYHRNNHNGTNTDEHPKNKAPEVA